ncbi:50S ribosome-binding GTPase [Virgisporangium ochraceum]
MTQATHVRTAVWDLLTEASRVYRDSRRATTWLRDHLYRLDEPLRIAVTGRAHSGKSTLINLLIGEDVAPVDVGGEPLTWYQDGSVPRVTVYPDRGPAHDLPVARLGTGLRLDLTRWKPCDGDEVVVERPMRALRHAQLIDAPAVTPAGGDGSVARRVLRDADAVLYLAQQVNEADLTFLRSTRTGTGSLALPVNVLVVLSRADEIGGGRIDALGSARQVARRQGRDPRVHHLCQNVVALSPLLARTGSTLTDSEFLALATLADVPRAGLEPFLLSTDRFTGADFPVPLDTTVRGALLDRLGLFGVRLAVTLIRTGGHTREKVAEQLVRRSGLTETRESIREFFLDRRQVLKARTALLALDFMLRAEPRDDAGHLHAELERIVASTHDFQELRTLAALRTRRVILPDPSAAEARRLLGADGTSVPARLGLENESSDDDLWARLHDALHRWVRETHNAQLTTDQRRVASVVVRSCEGMLSSF